MNEINAWIQDNWYSLGSLFAQFAFLAAGVWFARRILKSIRASQEQVGALLKLSVSDSLHEQSKENSAAHRQTPYVMAEWPAAEVPAGEAPALSQPESEPRGSVFGGIIHWLQTPMASGESPAWRRVVRGLQAPAGS